jgi:hypothetical protein
MVGRVFGALSGLAGCFGVREGAAVLVLTALTLTLAGPLLVSGAGVDPTFCCRSGRCCCDSGKESTEHRELKAACRCARPDGSAVVFALPLGVLSVSAALTAPATAEPLGPLPAAVPQEGEPTPPDQPPRPSPRA